MTLLITVFAAVITTIVWYRNAPNDTMKREMLCFMYWGASLMWLVDAIFEYAEMGAEFFAPAAADMLNDTYLGLSVVALGLIVWIIYLLIKDPRVKIEGRTEEELRLKTTSGGSMLDRAALFRRNYGTVPSFQPVGMHAMSG